MLLVDVGEEGDPFVYYAVFASLYVGFLAVPELVDHHVVVELRWEGQETCAFVFFEPICLDFQCALRVFQ